jgi:hypothetical protein
MGRKEGEPTEENGLARISSQADTFASLIKKRQDQAVIFRERAQELRRQADRSDAIAEHALSRIPSIQLLLEAAQKETIIYTESLVTLASYFRSELITKRDRLASIKREVEAGSMHRSIGEMLITQLNNEVTALEEQGRTDVNLRRGLSMLAKREEADAEKRQEELLMNDLQPVSDDPIDFAVAPTLSSSPELSLTVAGGENLPQIEMMWNKQLGIYTIGDQTLEIEPGTGQHTLLLNLVSNEVSDPSVGILREELMRAFEGSAYGENLSQLIRRVNVRFRTHFNLPEDFDFIVALGARGSRRYSLSVKGESIQDLEEVSMKADDDKVTDTDKTITMPKPRKTSIYIDLLDGQIMVLNGQTMANGAEYIIQTFVNNTTFTIDELIRVARGISTDKSLILDPKLKKSLSVHGSSLRSSLNVYFRSYGYEIREVSPHSRNTFAEHKLFRRKSDLEISATEVSRAVGERKSELGALTSEGVVNMIDLREQDMCSLLARAQRSEFYEDEYAKRQDIKDAEMRLISKIDEIESQGDLAVIAQRLCDSFTKVADLLSLPEEQRQRIIDIYDEDIQLVLLWLTEDKNRFVDFFYYAYHLVNISKYVVPSTSRFLLTTYSILGGNKPSDTGPVMSRKTRLDPERDKRLRILDRDPQIRDTLKQYVVEIGSRVPRDDRWVGAMITESFKDSDISIGGGWSSETYLGLMAEKGIIIPEHKRKGGNYHPTYLREQMVLVRYYHEKGRDGGLTTALVKEIKDLIDEAFVEFDKEQEKTRGQK